MSREVKADFNVLKDFIGDYSIGNILEGDFTPIMSQFHKKYYAYLTLISEIQANAGSDILSNVTQEQILYISESCSDIGTSFFNLFHGAYKSSKLILRSSIETFIKGFTKDVYENVTTETSIFEIFRVVKSLAFFQEETPKKLINSIHGIYKELCADVHTAQETNMGNVSALNHFPTFSKQESQKITNKASTLICDYTTLISIKYNAFYHTIHYKNIDIIKYGIEKKYRPLINNEN